LTRARRQAIGPARKFADEQIVVAGRQVHATRCTFITAYLAGSIWYDEESVRARAEFERDSSKICAVQPP